MTTTLDAIATYLQTNGHGTIGTTLWKNYMPDGPLGDTDSVVAVTEYLSNTPIDTMGAHAPYIELPRIQVIVRRVDYSSARTEADSIYNLLVMVLDQDLSGNRYTITPLDTPAMTGRDDARRVLVTCNYAVRRMT